MVYVDIHVRPPLVVPQDPQDHPKRGVWRVCVSKRPKMQFSIKLGLKVTLLAGIMESGGLGVPEDLQVPWIHPSGGTRGDHVPRTGWPAI